LVTNSALAPGLLTVSNGTFAGIISGSNTLCKAGPGLLTLAGANTYAGATLVSNGVLRLGGFPTNNLLYWLDAADTNTVITSGGRITAWNDKSGNGRHFSQSVVANQPTYLLEALNELPVVRFAGGTVNLTNTFTYTANTVFFVVRPNSVAILQSYWGASNPADKGIRFASATSYSHPGDANDFATTGGGGAIYINGVATTSFSAVGAHLLTAYRGATHPAYQTTGLGGYYAGRFAPVDLAEVMVFSSVLTATERQMVETYLLAKWGLGSALANALPAATDVTVANPGILNVNGVPQIIGSLTGDGTITNFAGDLTVGASDASTTFAGDIQGAGGLKKIGSGTLTLTGVSSYTGATTVSNGTLLVNGQIGVGTNAVMVAGGALAGNGVVNAAVAISSGGTLTPGASIGILTISNSLTLAGTTFMEISKAALTNDRVRGLTTLTYGGTLVVTNLGGALAIGDRFILFDSASYSGSFLNLQLPVLPPHVGWDIGGLATDGSITIVVTNQAPLATNTNAGTVANRPVAISTAKILTLCSDPDGDPVTLASVSQSTNGALVTLSANEITYTPVLNFVGADQFTYTVSDGQGGNATGAVEVLVYPGNLASLNIVSVQRVGNNFQFTFAGIPGRTYQIERALDVTGPWINVATMTAEPTGLTSFVDANSPPGTAFYRTVYP
jgi:autotransporter-associated beta strand protein